jgi:hypothetical protein
MNLIQSAKLNGHDLYVYLKDVLARLPTQHARDIADLLPHQWGRRSRNDGILSLSGSSEANVEHPSSAAKSGRLRTSAVQKIASGDFRANQVHAGSAAKAGRYSLKCKDTRNSRGSPGCAVTPFGTIADVGVTR